MKLKKYITVGPKTFINKVKAVVIKSLLESCGYIVWKNSSGTASHIQLVVGEKF